MIAAVPWRARAGAPVIRSCGFGRRPDPLRGTGIVAGAFRPGRRLRRTRS